MKYWTGLVKAWKKRCFSMAAANVEMAAAHELFREVVGVTTDSKISTLMDNLFCFLMTPNTRLSSVKVSVQL